MPSYVFWARPCGLLGNTNTHDDQSHTTLATRDAGDRNNFPPHLAAQQAPPTCPGEPVPLIASLIRSWILGQPRHVGNGRCAATGGGGFFTAVNIAELQVLWGPCKHRPMFRQVAARSSLKQCLCSFMLRAVELSMDTYKTLP